MSLLTIAVLGAGLLLMLALQRLEAWLGRSTAPGLREGPRRTDPWGVDRADEMKALDDVRLRLQEHFPQLDADDAGRGDVTPPALTNG